MISMSFLSVMFGKIGDFFFLDGRAERRPLLTELHRIGELWHSLKTRGIDVAQVGHGWGLFPGSFLISRTDRRAAAVGVSV